MIFATENAVADILSGKKCQTRRLVKEGEILGKHISGLDGVFKQVMIYNEIAKCELPQVKIKWQVGRDYCVQAGRGKPGLWYCSKCGTINTPTSSKVKAINCIHMEDDPISYYKAKPLRIKLTGIRKERLFYISKEDVKKEGFSCVSEFLCAFYKINKINYRSTVFYTWITELRDHFNNPESEAWIPNEVDNKHNPEVWVLEFSVEK